MQTLLQQVRECQRAIAKWPKAKREEIERFVAAIRPDPPVPKTCRHCGSPYHRDCP